MGVINTNWNARNASMTPKSKSVAKYNENGQLRSKRPQLNDDSDTVATTGFVQTLVGRKSNKSNIIRADIEITELMDIESESWKDYQFDNGSNTLLAICEDGLYSANSMGPDTSASDFYLENAGYDFKGYGIPKKLALNPHLMNTESKNVVILTDSNLINVNWQSGDLSECIDENNNPMSNNNITDIIYDKYNNKYIALGTEHVYSSEDGNIWTDEFEYLESQNFVESGLESSAIGYNEDGTCILVSISENGRVAISYSLHSFMYVSLPIETTWTSITYGDGKFIAAGHNSALAYSTDGLNWAQCDINISDFNTSSITYGDGLFIAVGENSDTVIYSTNGIEWSISELPTTMNIGGIAFIGHDFIGLSSNSDKGVYITVNTPTLLANNWIEMGGKYVYRFESDLIKSSNTILELCPYKNITVEQYNALQYASIIGGDQGYGYINLIAMGEVPTIDIPITFIVRSDV